MDAFIRNLDTIRRVLPAAKVEAEGRKDARPLWNVIHDAEALIEGRPTSTRIPDERVAEVIARWLSDRYPDLST